jgi:hypothetical protein
MPQEINNGVRTVILDHMRCGTGVRGLGRGKCICISWGFIDGVHFTLLEVRVDVSID